MCAFHGSMVWHRCCQHIQVKEGGWFGFHPFNGHTSPWPSCREVEGGGWITIADSRTVAVVSVPASPWYGSPSMAADAAWGFVWPSHGSMAWHRCCQHIQVKEGGWFAIVSLFHPFRCFTCFSCIGETATPRHGHRVERWKAADGSPSLTVPSWPWQIGRASCRERVYVLV